MDEKIRDVKEVSPGPAFYNVDVKTTAFNKKPLGKVPSMGLPKPQTMSRSTLNRYSPVEKSPDASQFKTIDTNASNALEGNGKYLVGRRKTAKEHLGGNISLNASQQNLTSIRLKPIIGRDALMKHDPLRRSTNTLNSHYRDASSEDIEVRGPNLRQKMFQSSYLKTKWAVPQN